VIDVKADFAAADRVLSDLGRKQLPFAMAMAINETAMVVKAAEAEEIGTVFDRPTRFTQNGLFVSRASKTRLTATVGVKRVQAGYLELQVTGGTRRPRGQALVVPVSARLNAYGNLPRRALQTMKRKKGAFVSRKGGHLPPGIYQRTGRKGRGGLKMLVAFEPRATYRARYRFGPVAENAALGEFEGAFFRWLRKAVETA
jgi:hypothetical protein